MRTLVGTPDPEPEPFADNVISQFPDNMVWSWSGQQPSTVILWAGTSVILSP
jgi:hypothetical protein